MEVGNHLTHAGDTARHAANHVMLVAVVYAHVGISRPDKYRIYAAVALLQIIEVVVNGVLACDGVIEKAVLHHHLRLHEAGLRPRQIRYFVA